MRCANSALRLDSKNRPPGTATNLCLSRQPRKALKNRRRPRGSSKENLLEATRPGDTAAIVEEDDFEHQPAMAPSAVRASFGGLWVPPDIRAYAIHPRVAGRTM